MMKKHSLLTGTIVHGKALGRTVGMPTANLRVEEGLLPKQGVYASLIQIQGKTYQSVTNIGRRPSVDLERAITVESFILDFDKDIYDECVKLELCKFLRPIQVFENLKQVQQQVQKDVETARAYFGEMENFS